MADGIAATGTGAGLYREHAPPPALAGMVQAVWHARMAAPSPGPTPAGTAPFRVLPDGCMDLIVAHGGGLDPVILIAGTDDTARMVAHQPGRRHIGLRFRPGRMAALIDAPPAELVGTSHPAALLLAGGVHDAARHLADAPADPARLDRLMRALGRAIEDRRRFVAPAAIGAALDHLATSDAPLSIGQLAAETGYGQRRFDRAVLRATGLTPRHLARVFRLQRMLSLARDAHAADILGLARVAGLADLAAAAGYADQPHMTRDCRSLTGLPPARLLAEQGIVLAVRKLQDRAGPHQAC
ncbi:helix-turn-helix domain-containing protein [Tistrella bauzanensis]|uniref:DUF6597 domain-containing transcriptional factor n=1 Tax=Tistrella arctica TaxID=3133430 RepID=A0ABU9YMS4_9PROT